MNNTHNWIRQQRIESRGFVKIPKYPYQVAVAALVSSVSATNAAEVDRVRTTIQSLYAANEKSLLCYTQEDGIDPKLIKIPERFFSKRFMDHYRPVCLGKSDFQLGFDIRSGDPNIFILRGYRSVITKLDIGKPLVDGPAASVKVTYDLEGIPFKAWGNFARYKLVREGDAWKIDDVELGGTGAERESMTGLPSIPSLTSYIDANVAKAEAGKK